MKVIAYDMYPNKELDIEYESLDFLLQNASDFENGNALLNEVK